MLLLSFWKNLAIYKINKTVIFSVYMSNIH